VCDKLGDLFAASPETGLVFEVPAGTTTEIPLANVSDLGKAEGVVLGPNGNLYGTSASGAVFEVVLTEPGTV
jgi:hypothetical protein